MRIGHIRITSRPIGEAPDWVRDAWIGLVLPTKADIKRWQTVGVLSGPHGFFRQLFALLMGRSKPVLGFIVEAESAVHILKTSRPDAAEWWIENAEPIISSTGRLVFDDACCERID